MKFLGMKLSEIIISDEFKKHPPTEWKMQQCRDYYNEHGCLDRNIVISKDGILIDGYVAYLVLLENGVNETDIVVSDLYSGETMYVFGHHHEGVAEYVWRVAPDTRDVSKLTVGHSAIVRTKYGNRAINVSRIEYLKKPPVDGRIRTVVQCL